MRTMLPALVTVVYAALAAHAAAHTNGQELYETACAQCHGRDGRGNPLATGIEVPLPDLTDCSFNTREPSADWVVVVRDGGPAMGLSSQMPAFSEAFDLDQIEQIIGYVRTFCSDERWPRGELNFRRPIFTSKAFPENELVVTQQFAKGKGSSEAWMTQVQGEMRVGPRGQIEVVAPLRVNDLEDESAEAGIGDLALSYKHVMLADLERLTIASAGLELVAPTGDDDRGLGEGTVIFEPSAFLGTAALSPLVVQAQITALLSVDEDRAGRGARYRIATSYPLGPSKRDWWPTLELEGRHDTTNGGEQFFLTPQVYKAIRRRGHVAVAAGVQIPVGDDRPFDYRLVAFLLWEWLDGGLWW